MTTLRYAIPNSNFIAGDVQIFESAGGPLSDVIRFEPDVNNLITYIYFFSDNSDPDDTALADVGLPSGVYNPNNQELPYPPSAIESGTEGNNFALYTPQPDPTPGETGFGGGTYKFISDGVLVPEPATWTLMGCGLALLLLWQRRGKRV